MPIQLRTDTFSCCTQLKKILAICTEPRAFRRLHEVFADHSSVKEWKLRHGSLLWRHAKTTAWMFASLAFSYGLELGYIFAIPPSPLARSMFPISTYLPLAFTIMWSAIRG